MERCRGISLGAIAYEDRRAFLQRRNVNPIAIDQITWAEFVHDLFHLGKAANLSVRDLRRLGLSSLYQSPPPEFPGNAKAVWVFSDRRELPFLAPSALARRSAARGRRWPAPRRLGEDFVELRDLELRFGCGCVLSAWTSAGTVRRRCAGPCVRAGHEGIFGHFGDVELFRDALVDMAYSAKPKRWTHVR